MSKPLLLRAGLRRRVRPVGRAAHRKHNRTPTPGDSMPTPAFVRLAVLVAACGLVTACSNPGVPAEPPRSGGATGPVTVVGDWDDIAAAIDRAAPSAAVSPLRISDADTPVTRLRTAELLAVDGQTARVVFSARQGEDPRPITIEATFGAPDDARRARALIDLIAAEIESLAGVEIAPR